MMYVYFLTRQRKYLFYETLSPNKWLKYVCLYVCCCCRCVVTVSLLFICVKPGCESPLRA